MIICFVGGGNMASALIGGMLGKGYAAQQVRVVEINDASRTHLEQTFGVRAVAELASGIAGSDIIVLAVKPQQLREVAQQLEPLLGAQLIISIAAGIRATDIARWLGTQRIVRAMPNTPALVHSSITGLYALPGVDHTLCESAGAILSAVGSTVWLDDESMMDALTAVSGSGPGYVFYFIEALQQAAWDLGFDTDTGRRLAVETFLGAARLASSSSEGAEILRARVTSRNGTTERALLSMEAEQVKSHIVEAVKRAANRSRELGDELGNAP